MTLALEALVRRASTELGSEACRDGRHQWAFDGGRSCPLDIDENCSQAVYRCRTCDDHDYGNPGGPGFEDCEQHCHHRVARATVLLGQRVDPLGYEWFSRHEWLKPRHRHQTMLRALRRQPKPRLP